MKKNTTVSRGKSRVTYEALEEIVRDKVQEFIQEILGQTRSQTRELPPFCDPKNTAIIGK